MILTGSRRFNGFTHFVTHPGFDHHQDLSRLFPYGPLCQAWCYAARFQCGAPRASQCSSSSWAGGLRHAPEKECMKVLDFVGQGHRESKVQHSPELAHRTKPGALHCPGIHHPGVCPGPEKFCCNTIPKWLNVDRFHDNETMVEFSWN
jgi:hypothetical protein